MSQSQSMASLKDLLRFPFQGPDWQNRFLVGAGLVLAGFFIPIVPLVFVSGYALQVTRRVIEGEAPSLPAWDDWGRLGVDGLRSMVVSLVYLLPGALVYLGGMAVYFGGVTVMPFMLDSSPDASALFFFGLMALIAIFMASLALGMVLLALGGVPLPVATAHFVAKDRVGAAFRLREWWPVLRANKLGFFIDWVLLTGLWGIFYLAYLVICYSAILCCLLPFASAPAIFYLMLVGMAKFAQSYREGAEMVA